MAKATGRVQVTYDLSMAKFRLTELDEEMHTMGNTMLTMQIIDDLLIESVDGWPAETSWFMITGDADGNVVALEVTDYDHNDHAPEPHMYDEALAMMNGDELLIVRLINDERRTYTQAEVIELRRESFERYGLEVDESE